MYHEFTPCAALVPFIDKFWVFKGFTDIGTRFKILADGCTDFIFSIGNMTVPTDEHSMIMQPYRSYFVGPMRVYSDLTATTNTLHMLGVRFHPCGLLIALAPARKGSDPPHLAIIVYSVDYQGI